VLGQVVAAEDDRTGHRRSRDGQSQRKTQYDTDDNPSHSFSLFELRGQPAYIGLSSRLTFLAPRTFRRQ